MSLSVFSRIPDLYWPCKGTSEGFTELNAFDGALLAAGIGDTNLVKMSSIVPPSCKRIDPIKLPGGALVPVAYAAMTSSERGTWVAASVACGIPTDPSLPGVIMEFHGNGHAADAEEHVREMARQAFVFRNRELKEIISCAADHQVVQAGAAFAAITLWFSDWGKK
jgi:arginine decarboxylase